MITADRIVPIVLAVGTLILAVRSFSSWRLNGKRVVIMAAAWIAIIGVLTVVLQQYSS